MYCLVQFSLSDTVLNRFHNITSPSAIRLAWCYAELDPLAVIPLGFHRHGAREPRVSLVLLWHRGRLKGREKITKQEVSILNRQKSVKLGLSTCSVWNGS
jgi:hypothetical protein